MDFHLPPIHLTVATAGLYVQVIPVFVLALLLEGPGKLREHISLWFAVVNQLVRQWAILLGSYTSIACLFLVGANVEGNSFNDALAAVSLILIAVAIIFFAIRVMVNNYIDLVVERAKQLGVNIADPRGGRSGSVQDEP